MATIEYEAQVGVGDGSGQLFVYGSYDAVKRVQALILENERLRAARPFNGLSPAEVERLALLAEEMGIETGIDIDALIEAGHFAERIVGDRLPSAALRGGSLKAFRAAIAGSS